jgi:SAM-dependent methyltransferase
VWIFWSLTPLLLVRDGGKGWKYHLLAGFAGVVIDGIVLTAVIRVGFPILLRGWTGFGHAHGEPNRAALGVLRMEPGATGPAQHAGYLLDNATGEAPVRFAALSAMFDPGTIRHLQECGVGRGWHCLEVGGGGGSIASWLADCVGPTGRVLTTDIDPRFLESLRVPNLEVQRHDIATDPLPERAFDLVHARLVLMHLPERERALARMISALKPGGWLVDEEYDSSSLLPKPLSSPGEVLLPTQVAVNRLLDDGGVDRLFGRRLAARLRAHGLACVTAEARAFMWQRGSPGAALARATYELLRRALIDGNYITTQQFEHDVARLDDPDFLMPSAILWSACGRRA